MSTRQKCYTDYRPEGIFQKKCTNKKFHPENRFFLGGGWFWINSFWDNLFSAHFFWLFQIWNRHLKNNSGNCDAHQPNSKEKISLQGLFEFFIRIYDICSTKAGNNKKEFSLLVLGAHFFSKNGWTNGSFNNHCPLMNRPFFFSHKVGHCFVHRLSCRHVGTHRTVHKKYTLPYIEYSISLALYSTDSARFINMHVQFAR